MRAAWIALAIAIAVVAAGAGLSRDALFEARAAAASGDHAGALGFGARAERLAPWDADPPQLSAEARMALKTEPDAALDDADRAVDRAPARAAARVTRARARLVSGDTTGAYADLAEAARLYPLQPEYATQRDALAAALVKASEQMPR
jgi:tetratricopeptide (TPR) repeat protein